MKFKKIMTLKKILVKYNLEKIKIFKNLEIIKNYAAINF